MKGKIVAYVVFFCLIVFTSANAADPPVVDFFLSHKSGEAPLIVTCLNRSSGSEISGYTWDFGDGATASTKDTIHTYTQGGTFNITLRVTTPNGVIEKTKQVKVKGAIEPLKNFRMTF